MAVPKGKQGADITVKAYKQTNMSSEGEQFDSCDVPGALIEKASEPMGAVPQLRALRLPAAVQVCVGRRGALCGATG